MSTTEQLNPLETFLRDYLETADGLWEQVEPRVYDLLLPESLEVGDLAQADEDGMVRVAFDPEAVPEHPGCQFMTLGTPLLDRLLAHAQRRSHHGQAYVVGLNQYPGDLVRQVRHVFDLSPNTLLTLDRTRALQFTIVVHWFSATYVSDQKQQDTFKVAIDAYHGRQVRHLDRLLDHTRLHESSAQALPEAPRKAAEQVYLLARDRVVRTVAASANTHRREQERRFRRQEERMVRYYHDLRTEVEARIARAINRAEDPARAIARRVAIDREQKLRLSELRQKNAMRVRLKLMNLLRIQQPKVLVDATLTLRGVPEPKGHQPVKTSPIKHVPFPVTFVWDPLTESLEAPACPACDAPTFGLRAVRTGQTWLCPDCVPATGRR